MKFHVSDSHEAVLGKDTDILGEIGMVDPGRGQTEHPRGAEGGEPHGTGRADNDLGESSRLQMVDDLETAGSSASAAQHSGSSNSPIGG